VRRSRRNSYTGITRVEIGEGVVVIHREGKSAPVIAKILGTDNGEDGKPCRYFLDRLVHRESETRLGGYEVRGAISTVLEVGDSSTCNV